MTSFQPRKNTLRVVAAIAVAAASCLASAVAHVVVVAPAAPVRAGGFGVLQAEIHACMAGSGRSHDECLDEIEGKALIQHAETLAQLEERQGLRPPEDADADDDVDLATTRPPRSVAR